MNALDTSFIIDYWRGEEYARLFFDGLAENEPVWIPTAALFELYDAALLSDSPAENVDNVAADLEWADPLPFDDEAAREAARIDAELVGDGDEIPLPDALIAGTARAADMTLVAPDRHFSRVAGLDHHNPATDGDAPEGDERNQSGPERVADPAADREPVEHVERDVSAADGPEGVDVGALDLPGQGDDLRRRQDAVSAVLDHLHENDEAKAGDLRELAFEVDGGTYASPQSLWKNAMLPALGALDAVESSGPSGKWRWVGPDAPV